MTETFNLDLEEAWEDMDEENQLKVAFIEEFAQHGVVAKACRAVGISRSRYRKWSQEDEVFAVLHKDAHEDAVDEGEYELRRRAIEGHNEPIFYQGNPVWKRDPETGEVEHDSEGNPIQLTVRKVSDRLLELYVKANRKAKYGDKTTHEHVGEGGGPIKATITFVDADEGRPAETDDDGTDDVDDQDAWT